MTVTLMTTPIGLLVAICALSDIRNQKIPNSITLSATILAISLHFQSSGFTGFLGSIGGWIVGLALLIIPYAMRAMGAGDVKLMAAIGAFVGPIAVIKIFLYTAIVGGVYALLQQSFSKERAVFYSELFHTVKHLILFRKLMVPKIESANNAPLLCYGIAIAIGTYIYIGETYGIYSILGA